MTDQRLEVLEQRFDGFTSNIDKKLDSIADALRSLIRIEERQISTGDRLAQGAQTFQDHETRLRAVELEIPKALDRRLSDIEVALPGLKELRRWVVTGVLSGVGMIGVAVLSLVLKG